MYVDADLLIRQIIFVESNPLILYKFPKKSQEVCIPKLSFEIVSDGKLGSEAAKLSLRLFLK